MRRHKKNIEQRIPERQQVKRLSPPPDYIIPQNIDTMQRAVIMAAGLNKRWKNYLNVPKQLIPVDGEPILKRTIRLLKERGINDIYVTVRCQNQYGDLGVKEYLNVENNHYPVDRLYGAKDLAPAIYLYGDVYYTEAAIDTILTNPNSHRFFGRRSPGPIKHHWEIYAIKADNFVIRKAAELRELHATGKIVNSLGGHLLVFCLGIDINPKTREHNASAEQVTPIFTDIDDLTTDFDHPQEYNRFLRIMDLTHPLVIKPTSLPQKKSKFISPKQVRNYYTFEHMVHDLIHEFLPQLPDDLDLVVGIPRDGVMIAYLISIYRNLPFVDLTNFKGGKILQLGIKHRKKIQSPINNVLVVDDICATGMAMRDAKKQLDGANYNFIFGALYASYPQDKLKSGLIDIYGCELVGPRHYQWTHCDAFHLPNTMMDIDGILCPDCLPDWDDDGEKYLNFLKTAPLKIRPQNVGVLITWRREKYRELTEAWLEKHKITYKELIMANREQWTNPVEYKAYFYKKYDNRLFIDSSAKQAQRIAEITGKPTIGFDTNEGFGLDE